MIPFLRNLVCHDFWLKLFSLALAVLIYLVVNSFATKRQATRVGSGFAVVQETQHTFRQLPVIIMSSAADVRNFRVDPKTVDVTLQGENVAALPEKDIRVVVDVTGASASRAVRAHIDVSTPPGIRLISVNPPEVEVLFPNLRP